MARLLALSIFVALSSQCLAQLLPQTLGWLCAAICPHTEPFKSVGNVGPCTGITPVKLDHEIITPPNQHVRRLKPQIHEVALHRCNRAGSQAPTALASTQTGPESSPSATDEVCTWEISHHIPQACSNAQAPVYTSGLLIQPQKSQRLNPESQRTCRSVLLPPPQNFHPFRG